jgi:hypothetical protein
MVSPAAAQDKPKDEARYKFKKGDTLKFEVSSTLDISQTGTHADFLMMGNDQPLTWTVNGVFENVVLEVTEDGVATLERRVRSIESAGHVQYPDRKDTLKYSWSREKDKTAPDPTKIDNLMDKFIAEMIANPVRFTVDSEGNTRVAEEHMKRLVMRRGMMYWPVKPDEPTWTSTEAIALPVLHDKIKLEFKNQVTGDAGRTGFKARLINAPLTLKGSDPAGFHQYELQFTVSGSAKPEFDMTNGRLHKLDLTVSVKFTGDAPVAGGGTGKVQGTASYKEIQTYKD